MSIKDRLLKLLIDELILTPTEAKNLKDTTTFIELAVDDLMFMDLIGAIMDEFDISLPDVEGIKTIGDLVRVVEGKVKNG